MSGCAASTDSGARCPAPRTNSSPSFTWKRSELGNVGSPASNPTSARQAKADMRGGYNAAALKPPLVLPDRVPRRRQDDGAQPRARVAAPAARRRDHQRARSHRHRHAPGQEPRGRRHGAGRRLRLPRGARPVRAVGGDRRGRARSRPDVVLLETTGIAEPWSILDGLEGLGRDAPAVAAGVVCVVDAEAGGAQLARHEEARAQVEAADRILLTKLDLAPRRRGGRAAPRAGAAQPGRRARQLPRHRRGDRGARSVAARRAAARRASRARTIGTPHAHAHGQLGGGHVRRRRSRCWLSRCWRWSKGWAPRWCARRASCASPARPRAGSSNARARAPASTLGEPWGDEPPRTELVLIGDGPRRGRHPPPDLGLPGARGAVDRVERRPATAGSRGAPQRGVNRSRRRR